MPTEIPGELAGGPRLGGRFVGPKTDTSSIWKGRPPVLEAGVRPLTLALAATPPPAELGRTVTVQAQCGNAWGGLITREFQIGGGLSAELRVGNFEHVKVFVPPPGIVAGMTVFFCWTSDLLGRTPLYRFINYPAPGPIIQVPEGAEFVYPEVAGTLTYSIPQFGATFTRTVAAGEQVPIVWSAFSCNVANDFIFQLRGL